MNPADIYNRLLRERVIVIRGEIDEALANVVNAQLLFFQFENKTKEIHVYIDSPGGSVTASLAIYDTMHFIKNEVATYAVGQSAGMALMLLCAGEHGKRFALPHARLAFTPIWSDESDPVTLDEIARLKRAIFEIFAKHTGQSIEKIAAEHEHPRAFTINEALNFGLVDEAIATPPTPVPRPERPPA